MRCRRVRQLVLAGVLALVWGSAAAEKGALELEADSIHYDERSGKSVYRGNVVITQGGMRLTGDEVEVFSEKGEFLRVVARAQPGTFQNRSDQGDVDAEARTIEYDLKRQMIVFMGDAKVSDGEKILRGERIIYDLEKKIVDATKSKGRVRLTIEP